MARTTGTAPGEAFASAIGHRGYRTIGTAYGEAFASGIAGVKKVSEFASLALADYSGVNVEQLVMITLGSIPTQYDFTSELVSLALMQIAARQELVSELVELASIQGKVVDQVSQLVMLSMVRADPGKRQLRAFTFNQDGHSFYVLQLGAQGTVVYDQLTKKWSEWKSYLYNNWKANYGITYQGGAIAGSIDSNMIYNIDPLWMFDERTLPIVSTITGGYPMRMRNSVTCDEIMVTSSVGWVSGTVNAQLQLRTSDDFSKTWVDRGTLDMSTATPQTEVSWRSLGLINAPGRIFELTDLGGAAQRINSMEMFSRDVNDG